MTFSYFDVSVLKFIQSKHLKPWDEKESAEIKTAHELDLATFESLRKHFQTTHVGTALYNLLEQDCIKKRYLYDESDFQSIRQFAGQEIRTLIATHGEGIEGYQITQFGEAILDNRFSAKLQKLFWKWLEGLAGDAVQRAALFSIGCIVGFLIHLLITLVFH
jgi:hypothetical protein